MLLEELRSDILEARQARWERLQQYLKNTESPVVEISVNIPGPDKMPAGSFELFELGYAKFGGMLTLYDCHAEADAAGYFLMCRCLEDAETAKKAAVQVEEHSEAFRLLDIDIYTKDGGQLGRSDMGLPARRCLICGEPAVDCIRSKRHGQNIVTDKINELLQRGNSRGNNNSPF